MTQMEAARAGETTPDMAEVARLEGLPVEVVRARTAEGTIALSHNLHHAGRRPVGIGLGLSTKVNANIGASSDIHGVEEELAKLEVALEAGADTIMDLSTGGNLKEIRRDMLRRCPVPLGTVPIYEAAIRASRGRKGIEEMDPELLFEVIEEQAEEGVDFMTLHCGITLKSIERFRRATRIADVVSRGGSFHFAWMVKQGRENPLYEQFDRLLDIARKHDVTLSLGDALRPGATADATDRIQLEELLTLGELVERSRAAGVQVWVEGPGHVTLDEIAANVAIQKKVCKGAPFYVLGPLVTDIGAGHDHITGAIGGAVAAAAGVDYLCYVTPAEHVALPDAQDVREGVIAFKIAAHAGDLVKGVPGARERDRQMSMARKLLDWERQFELALDPKGAREKFERRASATTACSMCGEFCAMDISTQAVGGKVIAY